MLQSERWDKYHRPAFLFLAKLFPHLNARPYMAVKDLTSLTVEVPQEHLLLEPISSHSTPKPPTLYRIPPNTFNASRPA